MLSFSLGGYALIESHVAINISNLSLKLGGCAFVQRYYMIDVAYKQGDFAWLKYEAKKGRIRSIVIKAYKITPIQTVFMDTYNSFYNENELISYEDAVAYATDYYDDLSEIYLNRITTRCP